MITLKLAFKQAWRDARAGDLRLLLLAVIVAVGAITSVGFLADRVGRALERDAAQMLGADLVFEADTAVPEIFLARTLDESDQFAAASHPNMLAIVDRLAALRVGKRADSATEPAAGFDQPSLATVFRKMHCGLNSSESSADDGDLWGSIPRSIRAIVLRRFASGQGSKPRGEGVRGIELEFLRKTQRGPTDQWCPWIALDLLENLVVGLPDHREHSLTIGIEQRAKTLGVSVATLGALQIELEEPLVVSKFPDCFASKARLISKALFGPAQSFDQRLTLEPKPREVFLCQVHPAALGVFDKIAKDVGQLKGMSAMHRHAMLGGACGWNSFARPDRRAA